MNDIEVEVALSRADFYSKLITALDQCQGCSNPEVIDRLQNMKFSEVVDLLAQNGIRMTYNKEWTL